MANVLALLSSLTWGVSDYVGGVVTRKASAVTVVLWSQLVGLFFAAVAAPIFGGGLDATSIAWGMAAGIGGGSGLVGLYHGFAVGRMAVVAPLASLVGTAIPVLVGIGTGERPSTLAILGILIAGPALWLVTQVSEVDNPERPEEREPEEREPEGESPGGESPEDESPGRSEETDSSAMLGLVAGLGFGLFFVFLGQVPESAGLWPLVPARVASVLLMAIVLAITKRPHAVPTSVVAGVGFAGAGDMAANMLFLAAAQRGLLSTVSVLSSLYPAVTVALARVFGEQVQRSQWVGIGLTIFAVVLITA